MGIPHFFSSRLRSDCEKASTRERSQSATFRVGLLGFLAMAATSGDAQPQGAVIWNDLNEGMTKEQVLTLYPDKQVTLSEGCWGTLAFEYVHHRLTAVTMRYSYKDDPKTQCGVIVNLSLKAKYGPPNSVNRSVNHNDCGSGKGGDVCRALGGEYTSISNELNWITSDGVSVSFSSSDDAGRVWHCSWQRAQTVSIIERRKL